MSFLYVNRGGRAILTKEKNKRNTKRLILLAFFSTIIFLITANIIAINYKSEWVHKINIIANIDAVNITLGIIAIPCCLLYYYMYKNEEFFILTLSFISIFLEYIAVNTITVKIIPFWGMLGSAFLFRVILLNLAIYNKKKIVGKILNNKRISVAVIIIIHVIAVYYEIKFKNTHRFMLDYRGMSLANIIIMSYYFILLCILVKRALEQNKFIYMIFFSSISIFTFRRAVFLLSKSSYYYFSMSFNKILSLVGFSIILIGLFIEVFYKIKERDELLNDLKENNNKIKSIEEDLREIREVEKIRGQFFANISHEFKTPINIIYSCIQLLDLKKKESNQELAEGYKKYDKTLKQNCNRMLRLINNLVDITKIDSGYLKLNFINCNIVELVEDITLSVVPYVENKKLSIIFDTMDEEIIIKCDPESIERVMLNLLSNAIKFTSKGGNIIVYIYSDEQYVNISVKDDGIGIADEYMEKVFERFIQGDKTLKRQTEGSGIGLSLVKSIVEMHKGIVEVNRENSVGTEVIVKLPNKKCSGKEETDTKCINNIRNGIVNKINLEFSDIYDL